MDMNKISSVQRKCIILSLILLILVALNYIFSPYKYIGISKDGFKINIESKYSDGGLMYLAPDSSINESDVNYYLKGEKIKAGVINSKSDILKDLTDKEDFYAIVKSNPSEKVYLNKEKDLLYFYKNIIGWFIHENNN